MLIQVKSAKMHKKSHHAQKRSLTMHKKSHFAQKKLQKPNTFFDFIKRQKITSFFHCFKIYKICL